MKKVCVPYEVMKAEINQLREHHLEALNWHNHCLKRLDEKEAKFGLNKQKTKIIKQRKELGLEYSAISEHELTEDTLLGIIMLESQPEKILTEFRVWLQERKKVLGI